MAGPEMKNPAGRRGKWKGTDAIFIPPFYCRLQEEIGIRCDSCGYRRVVLRPRVVKVLCSFLGEVLFKEVRHG